MKENGPIYGKLQKIENLIIKQSFKVDMFFYGFFAGILLTFTFIFIIIII